MLMFGWDSKAEIWSRFVFELVWTLVSQTQPRSRCAFGNVFILVAKLFFAKLFFFTRLVPNCPDAKLSIRLFCCEMSEGLLGAKLSLCQTATLHLWNKVEKRSFHVFFRSCWIECSFQSAARRLRCWLARPMRIIKSEMCFRKTWCWEHLVISFF